MKNSIHMDIQRMIKTKSTYIILAIMLAYALLSVSIMRGLSEGGLRSFSDIYSLCMENQVFALFISVFLVIFYGAELSTGFSEHLGVYSKWVHLFSKIIVAIIYILLNIVALAIVLLIYTSFLHDFSYVENLSILFRVITIDVLLYAALSSLVIFIILFFNKNSTRMIFAVLISLNFVDVILRGLSVLIERFSSYNINFSEYTIMGNISRVSITTDSSNLLRATICSLAYILFYNLLSLIVSLKKQMKESSNL